MQFGHDVMPSHDTWNCAFAFFVRPSASGFYASYYGIVSFHFALTGWACHFLLITVSYTEQWTELFWALPRIVMKSALRLR